MLARRLMSVLSKQPCFREVTRTYCTNHKQQGFSEREREKQEIEDRKIVRKNVMWFSAKAKKETDFTYGSPAKWLQHQVTKYSKRDQKFIQERHEILGPDLATAHFVLHRGGRVKFKNNIYWTEDVTKKSFDLPNKYDSKYILEAVDASNMNLYYEGLDNFRGLRKLKWLSFKNCKNIDDWGLDKISAEFPLLEYLDISDCKMITERGLESLYRMSNLKTLIVTNHYKSVAFELTCFLLEDCMPNLTCEILPHKSEKIK